MGRNSGVPNTRPKQTKNTATIVSIEMSSGSEATLEVVAPGDLMEDIEAALVEWRAECSWAE